MRAIFFLLLFGLLGSGSVAAGEAAVKPKFILKGHKDLLRAFAFSPDGKLLASGSNDGSIRLWDVVEGKAIRVLGKYSGYGLGLAFTPDGKMVAAGVSKVRLLPIAEGGAEIELPGASLSEGYYLANSEERPFKFSGWSMPAIFSPDGKHMAILKPNHNVFGKNANVKAKPLKNFPDVWKTYEFYDVSRREKVTLDAPSWVQSDYSKVTPRQLRQLGIEPGEIYYAISYDSKFLAKASFGFEGTNLWELATGKKVVTFPVQHDWSAFSHDGALLASSGSTGGDIYVWDVSKFTKK